MKKPEEIELDTKTLRFIVAIVDEGGLSRAAEALYLSQPALSRYLKRAEEALGTPVFYREHSGLTLTAAGKVFINGARSMLHLEQEAAADPGIQTGPLCICLHSGPEPLSSFSG